MEVWLLLNTNVPQLMVTRFLAPLRTDNSPQPKEAQPLSQLDTRSIQHFDSSALWSDGPEVALIGHFPNLYYPRTAKRRRQGGVRDRPPVAAHVLRDLQWVVLHLQANPPSTA